MESTLNTLGDLRARFLEILDVESGDGACALSLLDHYIVNVDSAMYGYSEDIIHAMQYDLAHEIAIETLEAVIKNLKDEQENNR